MIPTHSTPAYRSEQRRSEQRRAGRRWRLMTTTALVAAMNTHLAIAQNVTWLGTAGDGNYNNAVNWDTGVVPNVFDTAIFNPGAAGAPIAINLGARVGQWNFTSADPYILSTNGGVTFEFVGAGITGGGSGNATINNVGLMDFLGDLAGGSSTAGSATFNNNDRLYFRNSSTAGSATITNNRSIRFFNTSTAGDATITNMSGFNFLSFEDSSTAGSATITNMTGAFVSFLTTSSAGNATITNNGTIFFFDSTGGNATITNNGTIFFFTTSTGGNAAIVNNVGGTVDFSDSANANLSAGSIAGAGAFLLGGRTVTVGGNNTSTSVTGTITGTGALVKAGTGIMTLRGDNSSLSGILGVTGGLVNFAAGNNLGTGNIALDGGGLQWASGNTLDISSRLNALGAGGGTFDTNGNNVAFASALSGTGTLVKAGTGTLTLSSDNSGLSGVLRVTGGLVNFAAGNNLGIGNIALDGGGLQWASGNTLDISSRLNALGTGGGTFDTNGNNVTLASNLSGSGGLTKTGAGMLTLNNTNSYSGGTTLNGGTLTQGVTGALGTGVLQVNAGTLDLGGFGHTATGLSGTGGTITGTGGTLTINQLGTTTYSGTIAGNVGLTKTGAGTLVLNNANSYGGGTTLNGGTLTQGVTGALGTGVLQVNAGTLDLGGFGHTATGLSGTGGTITGTGGALTINQSATTTYSGTIAGNAGLVKAGAGTLTLNNANSYGGGTTLNGGTLTLGVTGALGTGALQVNAGTLDLGGFGHTATELSGTGGTITGTGGALTVNQSATTTYSGTIAGTGTLVKTGAGALMLNNANSYGGGTTLNGGTLTQGVTGALGTGALQVNAGTLDLGGFGHTATGLSGTGGTITGTGGALTVNQSATTTYSGTIAGTAGLVKAGAGALTLSGNNIYTGNTNIAAGTLRLGSAAALGSSPNVNVAAGATLDQNGNPWAVTRLTGTGTVLEALTNANGTVAPGNSPGTLTVQGNYTQGPGGTLAIAITPTAAAQLRVIGTASLGGTLALSPASGSYLPGTTFTVLDADAFDPAANRFASVTNSGSAFVAFDVIYDDAAADVIVGARLLGGGPTPATPVFGSVPGLSRNERAVAANADQLLNRLISGDTVSADGQVVLGNLLSLSQGGFRRAAEEIAGESHPLTPTVLRATRTAFGGFVFDRLGAGSPALAADTDGLRYGWGTAAADRAAWQVAALDGAGGGGGGGGGGAAGIGRDGAWIRGFGLFGDIDSDARSAGADYRIGGFAAGIDRKITDRLTLGLAAGYARTDAEVKRDLGSFDVDSYQFALYGRQDLGQGWFVNGLLGGGVHEVEARRRISFAQLNRVTRSDHTDESFAAGLNIGRGLNLFGLDVTPTLGLRYDLLVQDRFRENGAGSLDLTVAGHDDNSLQLQSGVKLARSFALGGVTLRPELLLGYAHEFLDATQTLRVRQSEPGLSSRDVGGPEQDRDTALIGVNLAMQATDRFRLFLRYDGAFSGSAETNAVTGGIRYNW